MHKERDRDYTVIKIEWPFLANHRHNNNNAEATHGSGTQTPIDGDEEEAGKYV